MSPVRRRSSRDPGGEEPALRGRAGAVAARMHHQRRRPDLAEERDHVDLRAHLEQVAGVLGRRRPPAQLVEPVHLLVRRSRHEPRREYLSKGGIVLAPAHAGQLDDGAVLPFAPDVATARPAARVPAVEDEAGDAFGVPYRVDDRLRRPLRDPEERERLGRAGRRHHRLQVLDRALERGRAHVPVAHAAAALVVADEPEMLGEKVDPMAPDRALPLVLEVRQPVGGFDQQRARPRFRPGDLGPVSGVHIPDSLSRGARHVGPGTSVPGEVTAF